MSNETGQVIKKKNPYLMMDTTSLRDKRLSWKAKGLMTYFLDKPDDWKFIMQHIYNSSTDGEASVRAGLKELQKYGYLVRVAFRINKKVSHYQFFIYEQPVAHPSEKVIHIDYEAWNLHKKEDESLDITLFGENQKTGKQKTGKQHSGNRDTLLSINNTNELDTKKLNNKDSHDVVKNDRKQKVKIENKKLPKSMSNPRPTKKMTPEELSKNEKRLNDKIASSEKAHSANRTPVVT